MNVFEPILTSGEAPHAGRCRDHAPRRRKVRAGPRERKIDCHGLSLLDPIQGTALRVDKVGDEGIRRRVEKLVESARLHDLSVPEQHYQVAEEGGLAHVVGDEYDRFLQ